MHMMLRKASFETILPFVANYSLTKL